MKQKQHYKETKNIKRIGGVSDTYHSSRDN